MSQRHSSAHPSHRHTGAHHGYVLRVQIALGLIGISVEFWPHVRHIGVLEPSWVGAKEVVSGTQIRLWVTRGVTSRGQEYERSVSGQQSEQQSGQQAR